MKLTARGYHRVLRVARTLADLDRAEKIGRLHLAEALSYRALAEDLRRAAEVRGRRPAKRRRISRLTRDQDAAATKNNSRQPGGN